MSAYFEEDVRDIHYYCTIIDNCDEVGMIQYSRDLIIILCYVIYLSTMCFSAKDRDN